MVSEADEIRAAIKSQANRIEGLMTEDALTIFDLRRENKVLRELAEAVGIDVILSREKGWMMNIANVARLYDDWCKQKEGKDGE